MGTKLNSNLINITEADMLQLLTENGAVTQTTIPKTYSEATPISLSFAKRKRIRMYSEDDKLLKTKVTQTVYFSELSKDVAYLQWTECLSDNKIDYKCYLNQ